METFHNYYTKIESLHKSKQITLEEFLIDDFDDYKTVDRSCLELDEKSTKQKLQKEELIVDVDVFDDSNRAKRKYIKRREKEEEKEKEKEPETESIETIFQ